MKHIPITIGIITKNRTAQLAQCIQSIQNKDLFSSDQLIIIDNSSNTLTKHLVNNLKKEKRVSTKITYIQEPVSNLPLLRNRVLENSKNNWIVYIDDDCIAHPTWVSEIQKSIAMYPNAALITGASYAINHDNVFSVATEINELFWKERSVLNNHIVDFEATDNKNIICNKKFLSRNHIQYETKLVLFYGFGEDCDFGRQIQHAGGTGYYSSALVVYHHNMTTFITYFRRLFIRFGGNYGYFLKWSAHKKVISDTSLNKPMFISSYFRSRDHPAIFILLVYILLGTTFIFIRFVKLCMYCYYRVRR